MALELLAGYTAASLGALPPPERVVALATLLHTVSLPWGTELPMLALAVPIAALRALSPELFAVLAPADKEQLLSTLCSSRRHALSLRAPPPDVLAQGRAAPTNAGRTATRAMAAAASLAEVTLQDTLAKLPLDAPMFVRRIEATLAALASAATTSTTSTAISTATTAAAAATAAAANAANAADDADDDAVADAVADCVATLEVLGRQRALPEPRETLARPLFELLSALQGNGTVVYIHIYIICTSHIQYVFS